ncbi:MAG: helix-turn-helix domain-containing protein [Ruminococcus sp.]|nr:helix-turn-helix domain-containing protein [Ruminococcus sp.]
MEIVIGSIIRKLRGEKSLSQETLAEKAGVTVQAVSKWENGLSCPDIALIPELADFFGVSCDYLLTGSERQRKELLPDDGVLRIVFALGGRILTAEEYKKDCPIKAVFPPAAEQPALSVEVHGSLSVEGDINGSVTAGDGVNCGNVGGDVSAGDGVNCGNVGGDVSAGDGVNCGSAGGDVSAGDSVNCGSVGGDVTAGDGISCGNVGGDVLECGGDIYCTDIKGDVKCEGDIIYKNK